MTYAHANRVIDARNLEPPEPFVRTMEALEGVGINEKLLLLLTREPHPLYRALEINGFTWQADLKPDGLVEILIWRKSQ